MTTSPRRRLLWSGVGAALAALGITAIVAVIAGDFGDTFWRTIGTISTLFATGAAALAAWELLHRHQLRLLGWALLGTAPAVAVTLLIATWKHSVSDTYGQGIVTAIHVLAAGLVVATLRLIVDLSRPGVLVLFSATAICCAGLVGFGIPLVWIEDPSDTAVRALLVLIVLTLLGYVLTPVVQRVTHRI